MDRSLAYGRLGLLLCFARLAYAGPLCADVARAAMSNFTISGTQWMCCSSTQAACTVMTYAGCGDMAAYAQCVSAGGVKACGVNEASAVGSPCGIYTGPSSSRFFSSLQGSATSPLDIEMVARHVLSNWPSLGYYDNINACCSATSCNTIAISALMINPCSAGACAVKCAGDAYHGICSTWCSNGDSGQYFLINAGSPSPSPPPAFSGPETKHSTHTPSRTLAQTEHPVTPKSSTTSNSIVVSPDDAGYSLPMIPQYSPAAQHSSASTASTRVPTQSDKPRKAGPPVWAIAALAVLGAVVASAIAFAFVRRRRRNRVDALPVPAARSSQSTLSLEETGHHTPSHALPPKYAGML
ncbi:hypothetical protein AURDEDRAFT_153983 [Auricularia subglabra TFB-10046 SS5]|nr:hypothetical protein AURDEDRAFT_153983 [Auricularia subglabra TFB-10046 SS5]